MTYRRAVAQLITAVEGIAESSLYLAKEFGRAFEHLEELSPDRAGASRQFYWRLGTGATGSQNLSDSARLRVADLELGVYYRHHENERILEDVLMSDYEVLTDTVLAPTNWDRDNSTIVEVRQDGDTMLPFSIDDLEADDGRVVARHLGIELTLVHRGRS